MGRRIEIELTSSREDGLWTWRAAGARQPKGELVGALLYDGAKVGDVVKVEAEFHVDGIEVIEVFAPKGKKERANVLELKARPMRDDELVTSPRVGRDDRPRGRQRDGDRDRGGEGRGRPDHGRRGRRDDEGRHEGRRERSPQPDQELRPKPKRLRPRRVHRDALLAEVGEEHRPIVEQVIKDGMPGVRAAIERQNTEAKEAGKPEVDAAPILAIAERNLPKARLAEWRDRADAALANVADLDLRDLRSVVVAGNDLARDEESRELSDQLKTALDERVEADHKAWLDDLESAVTGGRVVRALRLSSRPVKAGAPLPAELASTLAGQAAAALAPDTAQERWATVLDALAFSPVRGAVTPVGIPAEPGAEMLSAVRRLADRIPAIATLFGVDPAEAAQAARKRGPRRDGPDGRRRPGPDSPARSARPGSGRPGADAPRGTTASPAPDDSSDQSNKIGPIDRAPTETSDEAAASVAVSGPAGGSTEPETEAQVEAPIAPQAEAPIEPQTEAPIEPQLEAPIEPQLEAPAEALVEESAVTEQASTSDEPDETDTEAKPQSEPVAATES
jgi:hypothetical protein